MTGSMVILPLALLVTVSRRNMGKARTNPAEQSGASTPYPAPIRVLDSPVRVPLAYVAPDLLADDWTDPLDRYFDDEPELMMTKGTIDICAARLGKRSRRTSQRDAAPRTLENPADRLDNLDHHLDDKPERMMATGTVKTCAVLLARRISGASTPCPLSVRASEGILEPLFSPQRHGTRRWAGNQGTGDRGLYTWPKRTGQRGAVPMVIANPAFTLDDLDRGGRGDTLPRHRQRVTFRNFTFFKITRKGVSHVCTI